MNLKKNPCVIDELLGSCVGYIIVKDSKGMFHNRFKIRVIDKNIKKNNENNEVYNYYLYCCNKNKLSIQGFLYPTKQIHHSC
jgi:hypothetical protein